MDTNSSFEHGSIKIIEDFLPKSYADTLETICKSMPWYLYENISGFVKSNSSEVNTNNFQFGFSHVAFMDGVKKSEEFENILPLIYFMEEKTGIKVNDLYRIRLALNTSIGVETQHNAHVDMEIPHKVLLYYVNDSDGDTVMYEEMHELGLDLPESFSVYERVKPEKNKAVIFDGWRYHSSSKPVSTSTRFIINIDFN